MGTSQAFGQMADMIYSFTFDQSKDDESIAKNVVDLERYAEAAGINLQINQHGYTFHFEFSKLTDYMVISDRVEAWNDPQVCIHQEEFERCAPEFIDAWAYEARTLLQDAGLPHKLTEQPGAVTITFQSNGALMMFMGLRDAGYLTAKSRARLQTSGPVPPGALPY